MLLGLRKTRQFLGRFVVVGCTNTKTIDFLPRNTNETLKVLFYHIKVSPQSHKPTREWNGAFRDEIIYDRPDLSLWHQASAQVRQGHAETLKRGRTLWFYSEKLPTDSEKSETAPHLPFDGGKQRSESNSRWYVFVCVVLYFDVQRKRLNNVCCFYFYTIT